MTTSDLVLLAYIFLLVPAMLIGFGFARRKLFEPHHKFMMTTITIVNWLLIFFVMWVTYSRDVLPQVPQSLKLPFVLIPSLHLLAGLTAQLIATYLVIRMWFEKQLPAWFKVKNIKLYMRTTLALWLLTAVLGLTTWAVINKGFLASPAPDLGTQSNPNGPVILMVAGNMFKDKEITITTGTTVRWINDDTKTHNVSADDGSFDSGDLKAGATFDQTFDQPGDVKYYCGFHGDKGGVGMSGIIHVTGQAVTPVPGSALPTSKPVQTEEATKTTSIATPNAVSAATTITVSLSDDAFNPKSLTIAPGTTVHFVNGGKHKHTVTADDNSFDSGQLKPNDTFDQTFTKVGDVPLYCSNHGDKGGVGMSMVIHVVNGAVLPTTQPLQTQEATILPPVKPLQTQEATTVPDALKPLVVSATDAPNQIAYLAGVQSQEALILAQAKTMDVALKAGHIEDAQAAAEGIINIINGGTGDDLDKNGTVNQPGDSLGLKTYIFDVNEAANTAQTATGISTADQKILGDMQVTGRSVIKDMGDVTTQSGVLIAATSLVNAQTVGSTLDTAISTLDKDITTLLQSGSGL